MVFDIVLKTKLGLATHFVNEGLRAPMRFST